MNFKTVLLVCSLVTESFSVCSAEEVSASVQDQHIGREEDKGAKNEVVVTREKFEELLSRMENLEVREKSLENRHMLEIQSLRRQLSIQSRHTASLERVVKNFSKRTPGPIIEDIYKLAKTSTENKKEVKSLKTHSRIENKPARIRRAENEFPVAFFAKLTHHITHVGAHQPIVFDHVVTNIGNAYNSHFGSFVALVPGTYVFSTTLFTHYHSNFHAQFVKNGQAETFMYLSGTEAGYDTTSQTIVLQLKKGDDISVQNYDTDKAIYGLNYTILAGFLLQEDLSSAVIVGK